MTMTPVRIHVGPLDGPGSYDVVVGRGVLHQAADALPSGVAQVLLAHSAAVPTVVEEVRATLAARGLVVHPVALPDGEQAKTVEVIAQLWARMGQSAFTRSDAVVAVGGGAVTDAAGYAAASWLRGIALVNVSTTLAGMVDAAVGGKTGINTAQGKNLVGAFHPPVGVICDLDALATLPRRDLVAGMAEVVKHGFIVDEEILRIVESTPLHTVLDPAGEVIAELVTRSVRVKADVVSADLKESSLREMLNYGHTFGHAIEQVEGYSWRHGEAVAVGMVFVAELARAAGFLTGDVGDGVVARHRRVLASLGLPTHYPGGRWPQLREAMGRDKKTRGAMLRFVVLNGATGSITRLEGPAEPSLREAYDGVSAVAEPG